MVNPAIQNDFSYYRRTLNRLKLSKQGKHICLRFYFLLFHNRWNKLLVIYLFAIVYLLHSLLSTNIHCILLYSTTWYFPHHFQTMRIPTQTLESNFASLAKLQTECHFSLPIRRRWWECWSTPQRNSQTRYRQIVLFRFLFSFSWRCYKPSFPPLIHTSFMRFSPHYNVCQLLNKHNTIVTLSRLLTHLCCARRTRADSTLPSGSATSRTSSPPAWTRRRRRTRRRARRRSKWSRTSRAPSCSTTKSAPTARSGRPRRSWSATRSRAWRRTRRARRSSSTQSASRRRTSTTRARRTASRTCKLFKNKNSG